MHHDRAYQRAANELLRRRKERRLAEIGSVRQKQVEAAEERREARQKQQAEKHFVAIAIAKAKLERERSKNFMNQLAACKKMDAYLPPQNGNLAGGAVLANHSGVRQASAQPSPSSNSNKSAA